MRRIQGAEGETANAYNLMDHATNISYRTSGGTLIRSINYDFDAVGMIANIVSDDGSQLSVKHYQCDSLDRLIHESASAGSAPLGGISYSYSERVTASLIRYF